MAPALAPYLVIGAIGLIAFLIMLAFVKSAKLPPVATGSYSETISIKTLRAPPGGTVSVTVKDGKLTVEASGPGAEVDGVYSSGDQVVKIGTPK